MSNQEPSNKEIMAAVAGVKETTEQILEAVGLFSNKVEARFDKLEGKVDGLEGRMNKMEGSMGKLEHEMGALNASVKNYLELSDKRYLELRQTNRTIFKYLKKLAEKTEVPLDLSELEEMIK